MGGLHSSEQPKEGEGGQLSAFEMMEMRTVMGSGSVCGCGGRRGGGPNGKIETTKCLSTKERPFSHNSL